MIKEDTMLETIRLIATDPTGATRNYDLESNQSVFVGSSTNCGLQLNGPGLCSIHCHVSSENGKLHIQEWLSAEGTCVNGKEMSGQVELRLGDVIQIGKHQILVSDDRTLQVPKRERFESETPEFELSVSPTEEVVVSEIDGAMNQECIEDMPISDIPEPVDFESGLFEFAEEETYDKETVALLFAEIEDLQAALAQRDAAQDFEQSCARCEERREQGHDDTMDSDPDTVMLRMQELIDEANRSDERVLMLEEILTTAEEANRSAKEERKQLEAWVADIENRVGQHEEEHAAEINVLNQQLKESTELQNKLREQLRQAAASGNAPKQYEDTLENLQATNQSLQEELARFKKEKSSLEQRCEQISSDQELSLREERVNIAKEHAKLSRLRYELSSKLAKVEELPKSDCTADTETAQRIQGLRQHLREIHEQEKAEEKEASIVTRLTKLWKRVEY
ncbi:Chromosome partition protein Smc [Planctomycetes bacterium CA13]|uniref:Chromosome partition protein Smc n=1 Tax=Novipirellula herctigrandis TaxID=2527986 RepID=A0A5C5ZB68_9BACT|nr:Chromosome partition protein Smc [Planctomycetes bacterium CA13]